MQRFEVQAHEWRDVSGLTLHCTRCNAWTAILENLATLAELVQRADEHTEACP
jgi:hypothetical protein